MKGRHGREVPALLAGPPAIQHVSSKSMAQDMRMNAFLQSDSGSIVLKLFSGIPRTLNRFLACLRQGISGAVAVQVRAAVKSI